MGLSRLFTINRESIFFTPLLSVCYYVQMIKGDTAAIRHAFSVRFGALLDQHDFPPMGKGRVVAVADRYGITQGAAQKWLSGTTMPDIDKLLRMAQLFGVTVDDLLGVSDMQESVGRPSGLLNRYMLMQSIDKLHAIKILGTEDVLALPVSVFDIFQHSCPADLSVVPVVGNAMAPTFRDGSMVFANRSLEMIERTLASVSPTFEPLCVMQFGDITAVRRIIVRDGEKLFSCDHPSYERESFDSGNAVAIVVGALTPY